MSEWSPGRNDAPDPDRIALDSDDGSDLDEALQEAIEAVEAAEAAEVVDAAHQPAPEVATGGDDAGTATAISSEDTTVGLETITSLRVEIEELRRRATRTLADFDNYRKRVEREKQAQERYNGMEVLRSLLDIVDNLERALESDGPVGDLKAGVEMTLRQAEGLLGRHGVSRIEADGALFDPSVHEAVSRLDEESVDEPTVTAVLQSGYQMHERLLRPARVAVAVPPVGQPETDGTEEG